MLTVLGGLAEFERDLIRTRTRECWARAVARGVKMGRPPKLAPHQQREANKRCEDGEPLVEIGRNHNVSADDFTARGVSFRAHRRSRLDRRWSWERGLTISEATMPFLQRKNVTWDKTANAKNCQHHKIPLQRAKAIFRGADANGLIVHDNRSAYEWRGQKEMRFNLYRNYEGRPWVATFTMRGRYGERIHLISAHPLHLKEAKKMRGIKTDATKEGSRKW
jgi:uncharacterized DUF497 family protein